MLFSVFSMDEDVNPLIETESERKTLTGTRPPRVPSDRNRQMKTNWCKPI
jgi:hypothetical protein